MNRKPRVWMVLTAANATQAGRYSEELRERERRRALPSGLEWDVCPDPRPGLGSGGAALWTLYRLAQRFRPATPGATSLRSLFERRVIIVIHSGGECRRLSTYAPRGKVFASLPAPASGGGTVAVFDIVVEELLGLEFPEDGCLLFTAGDVVFDGALEALRLGRPGVTGLASPGTVSRAHAHAVYVADPDGRVRKFLQSADAARLERHSALDSSGRVWIDTGVLSLDPSTVESWLVMAGVELTADGVRLGDGLLQRILTMDGPPIDLYRELAGALPPADFSEYLAEMERVDGASAAPGRRDILAALHRALNGTPFHVGVSKGGFLHFGTAGDLLSNVRRLRDAAGPCALDSRVDPKRLVARGDEIVLESVHTGGILDLAGRNLVAHLPPQTSVQVKLPYGWGLSGLPVLDGDWSAVLFGIDDDFKTPRARGGSLGNRSLDEFIARRGLEPSDLWPSPRPENETLWEARLWRVGPIDQVLHETLWMLDGDGAAPPAGWRQQERLSLAQLLERTDHRRLSAQRRGAE